MIHNLSLPLNFTAKLFYLRPQTLLSSLSLASKVKADGDFTLEFSLEKKRLQNVGGMKRQIIAHWKMEGSQ